MNRFKIIRNNAQMTKPAVTLTSTIRITKYPHAIFGFTYLNTENISIEMLNRQSQCWPPANPYDDFSFILECIFKKKRSNN